MTQQSGNRKMGSYRTPRVALALFGWMAIGGLVGTAASTAWAEESPDPDRLPEVAGLADDTIMRSGLSRCRAKFLREKTGLVAFLGGSITHNPGWTQLVAADLQRRFPETRFTFVYAGIPSIDSSGHAFRFTKDVLEKGLPDLLFVEAAVNDLHNERTAVEQLRGMEGVVRRALRAQRRMDIVLLHFAEPRHTADYEAGREPAVIAQHERVASHYQLPSVNLAREVQRRMHAGQFQWQRDFRDLHPSPFGQRLYFLAVRRLFDRAWAAERAADSPAEEPGPVPAPLDPFSYDAGELVTPQRTVNRAGFDVVPAWKPQDQAGTRAGFVNVPLLVGERAGAGFAVRFAGRGIGLFLAAGPDTGVIEYRIDQGPWKTRDTLTRWSRGLHLPWVLMLETELASGPHQLELRLAERGTDPTRGTALRIRDILVNGPAFDLPPLSEWRVPSTLDGSPQPSLSWAPESATREPTPLLVYLHSWSSDYRQDNSPWFQQAVQRGWIYVQPNFRGVNRQPAACGSPLARQDVLDAVAALQARYRVDPQRIYLAGTSGGGHMALLLGATSPEKFSAVSAWVGISDLADWHDFHVRNGQPDHYAQMTRDALGGPPGSSPEVDRQYRDRSPLFQLRRVGDLPLDIAAGVTDGHTGSVPIRHSLRAFNEVAAVQGGEPLSDAAIQEIWEKGSWAGAPTATADEEEEMGRRIVFRRVAGPSRVTIFDGGHEGLPAPACEWLARQRRDTR